MFQRREAYSQQPDFVSGADHVARADAQGDLLDVLHVLVKLGQQAGGGVLLQPEELTGRGEGEN